jgi:hypothetical protein
MVRDGGIAAAPFGGKLPMQITTKPEASFFPQPSGLSFALDFKPFQKAPRRMPHIPFSKKIRRYPSNPSYPW